ncbi:MAG: hypothetical protein ABFS34_03990 [Gemmatimonadota bacterium]
MSILRRTGRATAFVVAAVLAPLNATPTHALQAQDEDAPHDHGDAPEDWIPEAVHMDAEASPEALLLLNRGFEALHNFWYDEARSTFRAAHELQPGFVMAYWGEAFSFHDPFGLDGGRPDSVRAAFRRLAPTAQERRALTASDSEAMYVAAMEALTEEGDQTERRRAFSEALRQLAEAHPEDSEAWALYAISVFGTEDNIRSVPDARDEAARAARRVLEIEPRHPGGLHYTIHAMDNPSTAERALDVAQRYAEVSHSASHAIHMPSHIFIQLALWDDAIAANERAFQASELWVERTGRSADDRDYHAADFLHYALLQQGRRAEARAWSEEMRRLRPGTDHWSPAWYGAIWEARERVETNAWGSGALTESGSEWRDELLATGVDAARTGDLERAHEVLATLTERHQTQVERRPGTTAELRWRMTMLELEADIAAEEGRFDDAHAALGKVLQADALLPPPNETPDPLIPVYELIGETLLREGRPHDAIAAFNASLERRRGRARSLLGLARAGRAADRRAVSVAAYGALLRQWSNADADLPELAEARAYLAANE